MSALFDVTENALYAMCLVLILYVLCDVASNACRFNIHNRVCGSLPPFHTSFYYNTQYIYVLIVFQLSPCAA